MQDLFMSLDGGLKAFWIIACSASLVFVIQTALTFIGLGDTDAGLDDLSTDGVEDGSMSGLFSFRNLINFLLGYGWSGVLLYDRIDARWALYLIAVFVGLLFVAAFVIMFRQMMRLAHDGSFHMEEALGLTADVYLRIPASRNGCGKVQFSVKGSVHETDAITDDAQELPTGSKVIIKEVIGNDTFLVTKS